MTKPYRARAARAVLLVLLAATALALPGCATTDPDGKGAEIVGQPEGSTAPAAAPADSAPGTRHNPVPAGTTVRVGDWQVTLGPTVLDAITQIATENQFNEPPATGRRFTLVPVTVTYNGTESGTPWIDLSIKFYGASGNTFGAGGEDDYCGVVPDSFNDVSEMFPGARGSGNACVSVPTDQVVGGSWIVENSLSFEGIRVFFALT